MVDLEHDVEERLRQSVLEGDAAAIDSLIDAQITTQHALAMLDEVLLPTMRLARQRFESGEAILPKVLGSAEVIRRAMDRLEPLLEGTSSRSIRVVLATLEGDVHHIGRALLSALMDASGYLVHDLGMQVPLHQIVDAAEFVRADAIGLSALLVSTSQQMPACVQELDRRGLEIPVLVGGAAINRAFGRRVGILPDGRVYPPGVFYCRDVFEGLNVLDDLSDPDRRQIRQQNARTEIEAERDRIETPPVPGRGARAQLSEAPLPVPPYWGGRTLEPELGEVWQHLDRNTLFRHHWGGFQAKGDEYERLVRDEFEPLLAELQSEAERDGWVEARAVMGYFPCEAAGDQLLVYHPSRPERVVRELEFPRQRDGEGLCMTDYFRAAESGERDVLIVQAVSAGSRAGEYVEELLKAGEYRRMLFVNGLASATAEALAAYTLEVARSELGLEPDRGVRFSWGYPACPDLLEQEKILTLLGSAAEIDLYLTRSGNLHPEHSTAAMVVHHPAAKYFSV